MSLLDSVSGDGSQPEKQLKAFLGKEPSVHTAGEADAQGVLPGGAVPSQTKRDLKTGSTPPASATPCAWREHPGQGWQEGDLRFCDFVASWVVSGQKQSTGEKRQLIPQQAVLANQREIPTERSPAMCALKVTCPP